MYYDSHDGREWHNEKLFIIVLSVLAQTVDNLLQLFDFDAWFDNVIQMNLIEALQIIQSVSSVFFFILKQLISCQAKLIDFNKFY